MRRIIAAVAAVLTLFALTVGSASASVISMTHATDPSTVATGFAGNPNCFGFGSSSILQTFEPTDYGVSGPFRITDVSLAWSGALYTFVRATDATFPDGNPVMTLNGGIDPSTDYSTVQSAFGGPLDGAALVPAGSHLVVRTLLDNVPGRFPPPVWGLNFAPSDGTASSWYSDCQTPLRPLSEVTSGTPPLTLTALPLSRADLSAEVQQLVPTLNGISAGEVNSLAQQALNGSLNDFLNHIEAKHRTQSASIYDYLTDYAQLLLGTTSVGYPCCFDTP